MERIGTKREFFRLQGLGLTGNAIPSWRTVGEAIAAGYPIDGRVMIRSLEPGWPGTRPDVPLVQAEAVVAWLVAVHGGRGDDLFLTPMSQALTGGRCLNAEVWDGPCGWEMTYSTQDAIMRVALRDSPRQATGVACRAILRDRLNENDWDDLEALFARWPGHVIELTAYDRAIGTLPGRRTVIWEIRDY